MGIVVPRLSEAEIEAQAISVLDRYSSEVEPIFRPPVPVDEIPERLLRLRLDFDDLRTMLGGSRDAIGVIWFERRETFIDQSLDPYEHPSKKGRYHFTIGHEIGHWVLHRRHVPNRKSQLGLLGGHAPAPSILCRKSNQKEPVEWQADRFSSYLLMPRNLVLQAWRERHGSSPWQFDLQKYHYVLRCLKHVDTHRDAKLRNSKPEIYRVHPIASEIYCTAGTRTLDRAPDLVPLFTRFPYSSPNPLSSPSVRCTRSAKVFTDVLANTFRSSTGPSDSARNKEHPLYLR